MASLHMDTDEEHPHISRHTTGDDKEAADAGQIGQEEIFVVENQRITIERRLVRRLDIRLLSTIMVIYIMNYVDRTAITTARLQGLEQDLHLTDIQYSVVLAIFFVAYCPAQISSIMILNRISRPSLYIGSCTVLWGLVSTLAGAVRSFPGLLVCRMILGFPEAAFYPGSMYLISRWYTRKELAFRSSLLFTGFFLSNACGNLIAAGILEIMDGKLGVRGWRWQFYIEGALTIFLGLQAMWLLSDYPLNTLWLSAEERHVAQVRLAEDVGEVDLNGTNDSAWEGLKLAVKDLKVLIFAAMAFAQLLGLGFGNFFPILTSTLGFSTTNTLLLAAPPWIVAAVTCLLNSRHADKTGERFFHVIIWWWIAICGYVIALFTMSISGRYVSLFFMACGVTSNVLVLVWLSNSVPRPPSKRAASIGIVNGFGNAGNIAGSFVWKAEWGPKYHTSMIIAIVSLIIASYLAFVLRTIFIRENLRLKDDEKIINTSNKGRVQAAAKLEGMSTEEAVERRRNFRYLY